MRKVWKSLKIMGIVAGALAVLFLLVNVILLWITGSRLESKLKTVRDAGDPVTLQELARPLIPAEQNAATYLRRAQADIEAVSKELASVYIGGGNIPPEQRSAADRKAVRAALEAYPRLFPLLEQVAACPDYNSELDYTSGTEAFLSALLIQVQKFREVVNILDEKIQLQVADGKRDEALHNSVTILRLARHLEREPVLVSHMVVCACWSVGVQAANRVLRSGPVSAKASAELEAELALADNSKAFERNLKTERAYGAESIRTNPCIGWFNRAYFNDDQCYHLDLIAEYIALASQTYADVQAAQERFREESKSWRHRLSSLLVPALAKVHWANTRTRAQVRCLRVLNALQQRPATARAGQPKLEELGLPLEATVDPFTGSPLHLRKVAGQWVIYSSGSDLTDDGGQLENLKDIGLGPAGKS